MPQEHQEPSVRGAAVIIDSTDVLKFVAEVEKFMARSSPEDDKEKEEKEGEKEGEGEGEGERKEEEEEEEWDIVHLQGGDVAYQTIGAEAVQRRDGLEDPFEHIMKRV